MKKVDELKHGDCLVIVDGDRAFPGFYDENLGTVIYTIPYGYTVIGYVQD